MKITTIYMAHLRNYEHFQYHTEFKDLLTQHGAEALKIQPQFEAYLALYDKEDEGIKKINKSALTAEIHDADRARDAVWAIIIKINDVVRKHFEPEMQAAAKRLKILFDTYGHVAQLPLNEQTAALYNILQDLQGQYAADTDTVRIKPWVEELEARNMAFEKLVKGRFSEVDLKSDVVVKKARAALDEAYNDILGLISAYARLEGEAAYAPFVHALNVITEKYAEALARRYGKKKAIDNGQLTEEQ
jgi:hypothetical protein